MTRPLRPPRLARAPCRGLLAGAGVDLRHVEAVPIVNTDAAALTYSAGMVDAVAAFVSRAGGLDGQDVAAWCDDVRIQAARGTYFFSLCRYLFVADRSA
ncbi:MAG: hypothetical protein ACRDU8_01315 [Egibacteraceae bacterium]